MLYVVRAVIFKNFNIGVSPKFEKGRTGFFFTTGNSYIDIHSFDVKFKIYKLFELCTV